MAFVSAKTIILFRSCFLWSLGYMLVMNPDKVINHPFVSIMGRAMQLQEVELRKENPLVGLLAVVLICGGLSDIPLLAVEGSNYITVNSVVVPLRFMIFFGVSTWCYLADNPYLSNALVFAYGFSEVVINFAIYVVIREEKNEITKQELALRFGEGAKQNEKVEED